MGPEVFLRAPGPACSASSANFTHSSANTRHEGNCQMPFSQHSRRNDDRDTAGRGRQDDVRCGSGGTDSSARSGSWEATILKARSFPPCGHAPGVEAIARLDQGWKPGQFADVRRRARGTVVTGKAANSMLDQVAPARGKPMSIGRTSQALGHARRPPSPSSAKSSRSHTRRP
jgi:hypothetical protein